MRIFIARILVALLAFSIGVGATFVWFSFRRNPEVPKLYLANNSPAFISQSHVISETKEEPEPEFNPSGYYFFVGKSPKGFEEIEWIDITTAETTPDPEKYIRWIAVPPTGMIRAGGKIYRMSQTGLKDKAVSFKTVTLNGISYHFTGRFLKSGVYNDTLDDFSPEVVLSGSLVKLRKGRKVVERDAQFTWFRGD